MQYLPIPSICLLKPAVNSFLLEIPFDISTEGNTFVK